MKNLKTYTSTFHNIDHIIKHGIAMFVWAFVVAALIFIVPLLVLRGDISTTSIEEPHGR